MQMTLPQMFSSVPEVHERKLQQCTTKGVFPIQLFLLKAALKRNEMHRHVQKKTLKSEVTNTSGSHNKDNPLNEHTTAWEIKCV